MVVGYHCTVVPARSRGLSLSPGDSGLVYLHVNQIKYQSFTYWLDHFGAVFEQEFLPV